MHPSGASGVSTFERTVKCHVPKIPARFKFCHRFSSELQNHLADPAEDEVHLLRRVILLNYIVPCCEDSEFQLHHKGLDHLHRHAVKEG